MEAAYHGFLSAVLLGRFCVTLFCQNLKGALMKTGYVSFAIERQLMRTTALSLNFSKSGR